MTAFLIFQDLPSMDMKYPVLLLLGVVAGGSIHNLADVRDYEGPFGW